MRASETLSRAQSQSGVAPFPDPGSDPQAWGEGEAARWAGYGLTGGDSTLHPFKIALDDF